MNSSLAFLEDHLRWRRIGDDLWTYHSDLKMMGVQTGRRMVAVRRGGDSWALVSPVPLDRSSRTELEAEGRVDTLVVPTAFHNTFVSESAEAFPHATIHLVEGAKPPGGVSPARCHGLSDEFPATWSEDLVTIPLDGLPRANEVDFFHPAGRTLLVSDLFFHIDSRYPAMTRLLFRFAGAYPGVRASRLFRALIRDRQAFLRSLDRILACDFDRVVMSHGSIIEQGGKAAIRGLRQQCAG